MTESAIEIRVLEPDEGMILTNAQIMKKAIEVLNKPPKIENVGVMNFDGTMKRAVYK